MVDLVQKTRAGAGRLIIACDYSPPRSGDPAALRDAADLDADFISMNYNPGRAVRANSLMAASHVAAETGKDLVFTIATRDMNRLAIQSLLLGADLLGIRNVLVVGGDRFPPQDAARVKSVDDYAPTELVRDIQGMNRGVDFRGRELDAPTHLCPGMTIDLGGNLDRQVALTRKKIAAGAEFLFTQPVFRVPTAVNSLRQAMSGAPDEASLSVFIGVQVMAPGSTAFGPIPESIAARLSGGASGEDIAVEIVAELYLAGLRRVYLLPPILPGGARDYPAAQRVIGRMRLLGG